ncbi:hypothetical protein [Streptomyces sp. NPDC001250]|uniref:hypothetical protein n=1 Tax=unclassified Streptomyces TaxID=2593676 RepID=UPI003328B8D5
MIRLKKTTDSPAGEELAALCDRVRDVLIPARAGYFADITPRYDEVLHEVAQRTEHTGVLGMTDIAALVIWKRPTARTRWVTALISLSDTHVRAVAAVRDTARTGRGIIAELPGLRTGDALTSAVLTSAAPQRMAVYDLRVQRALKTLGLTLTPTPGRYARYLQLHRYPQTLGNPGITTTSSTGDHYTVPPPITDRIRWCWTDPPPNRGRVRRRARPASAPGLRGGWRAAGRVMRCREVGTGQGR